MSEKIANIEARKYASDYYQTYDLTWVQFVNFCILSVFRYCQKIMQRGIYICKNVSIQISNYYSSIQEEWENFVSVMILIILL